MYTKKEVAVMAKELRDIHPLRSTLEIALHWAVLLAVIILTLQHATWWLYPLSMLVVGAQQYALLILLHDAQHSLLHPSKKVNNWLATWLIAAPCCTEFARSQKNHLTHHQFVGVADKDPDYPLYCISSPCKKKSVAAMLQHFMIRCAGTKLATTLNKEENRAEWLPVIAMQVIICTAFTLAAGWVFYFLLWLLPLAGVAVFLNDFRIFCEHSNTMDSTDSADIMITYQSNWLERFFVAPNHMNYHAEHHLFPHVPHYQLPKLHKIIRQTPELNEAIQWRNSYMGYMMHYLRSLSK